MGKIIFTMEAGGAVAHVKSLAVNREWRGLGLARVLFLACRATLTELGVRRIDLEAEEDAKRCVSSLHRVGNRVDPSHP